MIQGANEWIQDIHCNAVEHGWWEQNRSMEEVLALIHSEWSEALEEDRAGRPMVWHGCKANGEIYPCESCPDCAEKDRSNAWDAGRCPDYLDKPEGIAVELVDGCIRIMDWFGKCGYAVLLGSIEHLGEIGVGEFENLVNAPVPSLVAHLHHITSKALLLDEKRLVLEQNRRDKISNMYLMQVLEIVFGWLMKRGLDPEEILKEKHLYNVTRPYKHGKQY